MEVSIFGKGGRNHNDGVDSERTVLSIDRNCRQKIAERGIS